MKEVRVVNCTHSVGHSQMHQTHVEIKPALRFQSGNPCSELLQTVGYRLICRGHGLPGSASTLGSSSLQGWIWVTWIVKLTWENGAVHMRQHSAGKGSLYVTA
jgi:hypothetical protein